MAEKRISTLSNTAMTRGKTTSEMLTKQQDNRIRLYQKFNSYRIRLYQKVNSFNEYFQEKNSKFIQFSDFLKSIFSIQTRSLYKTGLTKKMMPLSISESQLQEVIRVPNM